MNSVEGRPPCGRAVVIPSGGFTRMMTIPDPRRAVVRWGLAAAAIFALSAAPGERAEALSLINPGAAPAAKHVSDGSTIEVRGGHGGGFRGGGGGFRGGGGGFHGGGFRGGRAAFHGGGFRGGRAVFRGGGYRAGHVFRGGGFRAAHIYRGGGYRYGGYHHRGYGFAHRRHFHSRYLRLRAVLLLPAPLLPGDLDPLRPAQDLPLSPVVIITIGAIADSGFRCSEFYPEG